jgi:endonuclease/exonuclease/phosphatase family metal-dependent hydrolase
MELQNLKISTYNVEWFFANNSGIPFIQVRDLETKGKEIATVIAKEKPHIIGLQEVSGKKPLTHLVRYLKELHGLNYQYICGKFASQRTLQKVAMLFLICDELELVHWDSFSSFASLNLVLPFITDARKRQILHAKKSKELFLKNVYSIVKFREKKLLILNFHLKANFDKDSTDIRELESILVEGLLYYLISQARKCNDPFDAVFVLGDFNDFDHSFKNAYPPSCQSNVLEKIKTSLDVQFINENEKEDKEEKEEKEIEKIIFQNSLKLVEPKLRESAIYHILIDHILYYIPINNETKITISSCEISHRKEDIDSQTRTSDHWPVSAIFSIQ